MQKNRAEQILLDCNALLEGHFLLTSGRHSANYLQCAKVLQQPKYASELVLAIKNTIEDSLLDIDMVISPAIGGIIVGYELARQLGKKSLFTERENGKMALRRGFEIPFGAKVAIAEDVITTGGSVKEVQEIVESNGGKVIFVACLVDRSQGLADFGAPLISAYKASVLSYLPDECPICKNGLEPLIKPGSRE